MRYLLFIFLLIGCQTKTIIKDGPLVTPEAKDEVAKNIILLIGDGMGLGQISAGMYANDNKTHLEKCQVIGLHKPYAGNKLITDSAAGATAFACGQKTYNGAISVDMDTLSIPTILEEAEEKGLATGLVASSSITHATPACFIAHDEYRKNYEAIALDFLDTEVDYFVGGGMRYFTNRDSDGRDLVQEMKSNGYKIYNHTEEDIQDIEIDHNYNFGYLTADTEPIPAYQGRDYLIPASKMALNFLNKRSEQGFFLMIEGSQIDWGGHANNTEYILSEFSEYNQVIGAALEFARKDKNTLVVITADHETGGFAIQQESKMDSIVGAFTSDYHTGTMIPVFAYGPGSDKFAGIYENTEIYNKMRAAFGWIQNED